METIDPPALETLQNQLSSFLCKLHSVPDNEKSIIIDFLKSTVSKLEAKESLCCGISQNVDHNVDNAINTNLTGVSLRDAKPTLTQLADHNSSDTGANEAPPLRGGLSSGYEPSDLFLKDIFNSAFSDQAGMSSLFDPESSTDTVNTVNKTPALSRENCTDVVQMTDAPIKTVLAQTPQTRRLKPKEPLVLSCPICHCTFTNWSAMEHHLYAGHTTNLAPVCWRCQGVFDNHATLLAHECFDWGRVHLPCQGANGRGSNGLTGRHRTLLHRGMQLGFPKNGVFLRRRCGLCFKSSQMFHSSSEFREHKKTIHTDELCIEELNPLSRGRQMRKKQNRSEDPGSRDPMELLHPKNEADLQSCVRRIIGRFCQMQTGRLSVSTNNCPVTLCTNIPEISEKTSETTYSATCVNFPTSFETTRTNNASATSTFSENFQAQSSSEPGSAQCTPPLLAEAIFQEAIQNTHNLNKLAANARDQRMRRGRTLRTMLWRRKRKLQLKRIHDVTRRNSKQDTSHLLTGPRKSTTTRRRYVCRCCFTEFRVASRLRAHHLFQHGNIPASLGGLSPRPGERGGTRSLRHEGRVARSCNRTSQSSSDESGEPTEQRTERSARSSSDPVVKQLKPMIRFPNPLTTESVEVFQTVPTSTEEATSSSNYPSLRARRRPRGSKFRNNKSDHDEDTSDAQSSSNPPYVCALCNRQYLTIHTLRRHESQSHQGHYRLYCGYCDYRTNERTAYDEHLARHFHVRQFACTFCNARFIVARELKDHIAFKHTNERNHMCTVCGMAFKTAGTLSRHRKIHGERKLHECNFCSTKFTRLSNLKRHMSNAHMRRNSRLPCILRTQICSGNMASEQLAACVSSNQESLSWVAGDFGPNQSTVVTTTDHNPAVIESCQTQPQSSPKQPTSTQEFQFIRLPTITSSSTTMETTLPECDPSSHTVSDNMCTLLNEQPKVSCQNTALQINEVETCAVSNNSPSLGPIYIVDLTDLGTSEGLLNANNTLRGQPADHPPRHDTCIANEGNVDIDNIDSDSVDNFGTNKEQSPHTQSNSSSNSSTTTTATTVGSSLLHHESSTEHRTETITWINPNGCSQSGLCYLLTRVDSPSEFLCSEHEMRGENEMVLDGQENHNRDNENLQPTDTISATLSSAEDKVSPRRHKSIELVCSYPSSAMLLDKTTNASGIWRPMEPLEADYNGVGQLTLSASHAMEHTSATYEPEHHHHQQQQQRQQLHLTSIQSFDAPPNHCQVSQKNIQGSFNHSEFYSFDSNLLLNSENAVSTNPSHSPRFPSPVSGATSPRTMLYPTSPVQPLLTGYCFSDRTSGDGISLSATTGITTIASSVKSSVPLPIAMDDATVHLNFSHTNQSFIEDRTIITATSTLSSSNFGSQFLPPIWCYPTMNATSFTNGVVASPSTEFPPNGPDQCSNFSVGYLIGQNRTPCSADQQQLVHYAMSPQSNITSPTTATYYEFNGTLS